MRGSTFLAVFLILIGLVMIVAALRGRAPQFLDALTKSMGATGGHVPIRPATSRPRRPAAR